MKKPVTIDLLCLDCGDFEVPSSAAAAYASIPKRLGFVTYEGEDHPRYWPDNDTAEGRRWNEWERRQNQRCTEWWSNGCNGKFELEEFA